jgi:hypothetical protein
MGLEQKTLHEYMDPRRVEKEAGFTKSSPETTSVGSSRETSKTLRNDSKSQRPRRKWVASENDLLKKYYGLLGREELLKMFAGRTWVAIRHRAHLLGVTKKYVSSYPLKQYKLSDFQKGHLAALIDGEGTVTLVFHKKRKQVKPLIAIVNKDRNLLEFVRNYIGEGRIVLSHKPDVFRLEIRHISRVYPLLKEIEPYLITKRERAKLVLGWCESRLSKPSLHAPYDEEEWRIYEQVREKRAKHE